MSAACARCRRREQRRASRANEPADVIAGLRRGIVAAGRRVAASDPEDLAQLLELRRVVDEATAVAVAGLRAAGQSDAVIARALGMGSRQAVASRWPRTTPGLRVETDEHVPEGSSALDDRENPVAWCQIAADMAAAETARRESVDLMGPLRESLGLPADG